MINNQYQYKDKSGNYMEGGITAIILLGISMIVLVLIMCCCL